MKYKKPVVEVVEGFSEGVFASSGVAEGSVASVDSSGAEVSVKINAVNKRSDWGGHKRWQISWSPVPYSANLEYVLFEFTFTQPAKFAPSWDWESTKSGDGTTTVTIRDDHGNYGGCSDYNFDFVGSVGDIVEVKGYPGPVKG